MTLIVEISGIVLGSIVLLTVCWTFVASKKVGTGGLGALLIGAFLVTASLWAHVQVQFDSNGFSAKLDQLSKEVEQVQATNQQLRSKALQLSAATQVNSSVLRRLSSAVAVKPAAGFDKKVETKALDNQIKTLKSLDLALQPKVSHPKPPGG